MSPPGALEYVLLPLQTLIYDHEVYSRRMRSSCVVRLSLLRTFSGLRRVETNVEVAVVLPGGKKKRAGVLLDPRRVMENDSKVRWETPSPCLLRVHMRQQLGFSVFLRSHSV